MSADDALTYRESFPTGLQEAHGILLGMMLSLTGVVAIVAVVMGWKRGIRLPAVIMLVLWTALLVVGIVSWVVTYQGSRDVIEGAEERSLLRAANSVSDGIKRDLNTGINILQFLDALTKTGQFSVESPWPVPQTYVGTLVSTVGSASDTIYLVYGGTATGRLYGVAPTDTPGLTTHYIGTSGADPLPPWTRCAPKDFAGKETCAAHKAAGCGPNPDADKNCLETCYPSSGLTYENCVGPSNETRLVFVNAVLSDNYTWDEAPAAAPGTILAYDPRTRPWYHDDVSPQWTDPYPFADDSGAGITVSRASYSGGVKVGVSAIDYNLESVGRYLSGTKVTDNTMSFIASVRSHIIIGSSLSNVELAQDLGVSSFSGVIDIRTINNTDSKIAKVLKVVLNKFTTLEHASMEYALLHSGGDIVMSKPIVASGLKLMMFVTLPYSDVMGEADDASLIALLLAVCISVAGAVLVFGGVTFILHPLKSLADGMLDVAEMRLEGHELERSYVITEVSGMSHSFAQMVRNLIEYRQYLPQSVLCDTTDEEVTECTQTSVTRSETARTIRSSGHGSRTSIASSGGNKTVKEGRNMNLMAKLKTCNITLAVFNMKGFHAVSKTLPAGKLLEWHGRYLERIAGEVKCFRGIVDEFRGDHVQVSFNTLLHNSLHRCKAIEMCLKTVKAFETTSGSSDGNDPKMAVNVAIQGCRSLCGNMGCTGIKKFSIIGPVLRSMYTLERWGNEWGVQVLADASVINEVRSNFRYRHLVKVVTNTWTGMISEILGEVKSMDGEWMYQIEQRETMCPYGPYNRAMELLYAGEIEAARLQLHKISECNPAHIETIKALTMTVERSSQRRMTPQNLFRIPAQLDIGSPTAEADLI